MAVVLAFDVYGTLIDTGGVVTALREGVGDKAEALSAAWREKQLEYSFRRGLMQNYRDFSVCTRQALDFACASLNLPIPPEAKENLLAAYRKLPAFTDAAGCLAAMRQENARLFAFSNGLREDVLSLLENAGIDQYFEDVISCDEVRSFKPNPAVYAHFLRRSGAAGNEAWMISGNPFDVIGALSAGMKAAWIRRSPKAVFDPWEFQPTVTSASLTELAGAIGIGS
jgi:2-haloacid dehalogenase